MPLYMVQAAYTAEAWAAMAKKPADRGAAVKKLVEAAGGKFKDIYFTMGEYDVVARIEAPDDVIAMGVVAAAVSAGHLRSTRTTKLLTNEEAMKAMKTAGSLTYSAP